MLLTKTKSHISKNSIQEQQQSLLVAICILGSIIRIIHYIYNRSLWGDEAFLGINFLADGWKNLFQPPLLYFQQAPLGFLLLEKTLVSLFGPSEYTLRAVSLIFGISAIFLFKYLTNYFLYFPGKVIALFLFALSYPAIYHSVEAKQYSTELFVSVLLYVSYLYYYKKEGTITILRFGLIGAFVTWFSYSSLFILLGIANLICIKLIFQRKWKLLLAHLPAFFLWIISFIPNYIFFIKPGSAIPWLVGMWQGSFLPLSKQIFIWLVRTSISIMQDPVGISWSHGKLIIICLGSFIGFVLFLIGAISLIKGDKEAIIVLLLPLFGALVASALHKYPFYERFILFSLPSFLLLIGCGFDRISLFLNRKPLYIYLIGFILLIPPIFNTIQHIIYPETYPIYADYRAGASFVAKNYKKENIYIPAIWGISSVEAGLNYYDKANNYQFSYHFLTKETQVAKNEEELLVQYMHVISTLKNQSSIWIVTNPTISAKIESSKVTHTYISETDVILKAIQNNGGKIDKYMRGKTIAAYHIQFGKPI
ncbi:hypothetical protein [Xanthocytophaga agilis]|uniref:Glycosyltransferase RgtA/B/C/D-like domain-containing protein n=1 Tax=Xanthocytophaga agilis TaxID=3048010 RepID=A0AAE3R1U4_9BACT|nr:hypothetical protein [Xanthocytophaga agilis]MDJ1499343.1 hypothetical protein [Xanthocytophaga agilis]